MLSWLTRSFAVITFICVGYVLIGSIAVAEKSTSFTAPSVTSAVSPILSEPPVAAPQALTADDGSMEARVLLLPVNEAVLSSEISGTITSLPVVEGSRIERGKLLVSFDCRARESELRRATAERDEALENLSSQKKLAEFKAVSELQLRVSQFNVDKAEAQIELARRSIESCSVVAPFNGRVVKLRSRRFETVSPGQPLLEIIEDSELNARILVPSRWLVWLKPRTNFTISIDELGKSYPASITMVGARVDPGSQTVEVMGSVRSRPGELVAGMSGSATFARQ